MTQSGNGPTPKSGAKAAFGDFAPKLAELTDDLLIDEIWQRPGLSPRDRSLITVATLVAAYRSNELPGHLKRALANGVTQDEVIELITHVAFYGGWPTAMAAAQIARKCFSQK